MIKKSRNLFLWLTGLSLLRADHTSATAKNQQPDVSTSINSDQNLAIEGTGGNVNIPGQNTEPTELVSEINKATTDIVQDHMIRQPVPPSVPTPPPVSY